MRKPAVCPLSSGIKYVFSVDILVLCSYRYGRLNNTWQSERTERSPQQQCYGHHVLQQSPLPGWGKSLPKSQNWGFSVTHYLFLTLSPFLFSLDYQGPNQGAKQTIYTFLLTEPRVWGERRQSVHRVPLARLCHHLWHHDRMGSCAFLSAGSSRCGRWSRPSLDVLCGETTSRAATAHKD